MKELIDEISDDDSEDTTGNKHPKKTKFYDTFEDQKENYMDGKSSSQSPSPTLKFFQSDLFRVDNKKRRKPTFELHNENDDDENSSSRSPSPTFKFFQSDLFREDNKKRRKTTFEKHSENDTDGNVSSRGSSPTFNFFQSDLFRADNKKRATTSKNEKNISSNSKKQVTSRRQCTLMRDSRALHLARELRDSVDFTSGSAQSDVDGMGVVAKIDIKRGKKFVDDIAKYKHGPVPREWHGDLRGNYIKTDDGYIILRPSHSEWMNEARCKGHKETGIASEKCEACRSLQNVSWRLEDIQSTKMLTWQITKDINKGEELLTFYL